MDYGHANNSQNLTPVAPGETSVALGIEPTPRAPQSAQSHQAPGQPFFTAGAGNLAPDLAVTPSEDFNAENWAKEGLPATELSEAHRAAGATAPLESSSLQDPNALGAIISLEPSTPAAQGSTDEQPLAFDPRNVRPTRDGIDRGTLAEAQNLERLATENLAGFYDNVTKLREQYVKDVFPGRRAS